MLEARAGTGAHPQFTSRTAQKKSVSSVSLRSDFEYDSNASHWPRFHAPAAASRATSARASASCVATTEKLWRQEQRRRRRRQRDLQPARLPLVRRERAEPVPIGERMLAAHTPERELEVVAVAVLGLPPLVRLARVGPAV